LEKTNIGLVKHCYEILEQRWPYVYGTYGLVLTLERLESKLAQYPEQIGKYLDFIKQNSINKPTVDCIGVFKSYLWEKEDGTIVRDKDTDKSADDTFNLAPKKGSLNTMPEIPGLGVHKPGHVGVYVGGNKVIEARGTKDGVVMSLLRGYGQNSWQSWFQYPYITYSYFESDWKAILSLSVGFPEEWIRAIEVAVKIASAGNLGDVSILKYLPDLIKKIHSRG
jgi:hypothetical protein